MENFKVLAGGVENLDHTNIREQIVKRSERQTLNQGINDTSIVARVILIGQLDQAKF